MQALKVKVLNGYVHTSARRYRPSQMRRRASAPVSTKACGQRVAAAHISLDRETLFAGQWEMFWQGLRFRAKAVCDPADRISLNGQRIAVQRWPALREPSLAWRITAAPVCLKGIVAR